jgi:hypothetical protein
MDKSGIINKLDKLKKDLTEELKKEDYDAILVDKLRNKIITIGMALTTRDLTNHRYG